MSSVCLSKSIWCTKSNFIYTSNLMLVVSEYQFTLTKIQCTAIGTTHLCSYSVKPIKDQERKIKNWLYDFYRGLQNCRWFGLKCVSN